MSLPMMPSVYRLLGKKDLATIEFDGDVAFRQNSGGHPSGPDWPAFRAFAQK
jgi:hypothetical protein